MSALVLKTWKVGVDPVDDDGNYVAVSGRKSGLMSWFLALVGVDPTTTIKIGAERVEFRESSLAGSNIRMIPLQGVCSTYYGYHKPWKEAFAIVVFFFFVSIGLRGAQAPFIIALIIAVMGISFGIFYYFLNRTLTLGFVENSGVLSGIQFKRSVIENVDVNEEQVRFLCQITQGLIEQRTK